MFVVFDVIVRLNVLMNLNIFVVVAYACFCALFTYWILVIFIVVVCTMFINYCAGNNGQTR